MNDILDEAASPGFAAPMAGLAREHPADIVERLNTKSIDIASAVLSALRWNALRRCSTNQD